MTDINTRSALYTLAHFDNVCNNAGGENIETSLGFVCLLYSLAWVDLLKTIGNPLSLKADNVLHPHGSTEINN